MVEAKSNTAIIPIMMRWLRLVLSSFSCIYLLGKSLDVGLDDLCAKFCNILCDLLHYIRDFVRTHSFYGAGEAEMEAAVSGFTIFSLTIDRNWLDFVDKIVAFQGFFDCLI